MRRTLADEAAGCRIVEISRDQDLTGADGVLDVAQAVTEWRDICSVHCLRFFHVGRELGGEQLTGIGGCRHVHADHRSPTHCRRVVASTPYRVGARRISPPQNG